MNTCSHYWKSYADLDGMLWSRCSTCDVVECISRCNACDVKINTPNPYGYCDDCLEDMKRQNANLGGK